MESSSGSECETQTATEVTAMCNIFTQFTMAGMGNSSTLSAPQTTCTSTKRRMTQGCEVTPVTTTLFGGCTKTQTATDLTKFCTELISAGVTYTPCTKTVSTVFEGCSVTATTTSVIDDICQAQVTFAPDDPQGEFGTLPANASNETCPYFPGVNVTVLDDQGEDGQRQNDTCPMPNGTRPSLDDDQGDDEPRKACNLNNGTTTDGGTAPSCPASNDTLIQGPDGAEDGNITSTSCPLNNTIALEPDGALDNDTAPLCGNPTLNLNLTMEQGLGQGEDGDSAKSCSIGGNSTLEVDNEQGEDAEPQQNVSCPISPDGMLLSPLADLGDYAPANGSSCPLLDSRFPISWLDEQGDDWVSIINVCPIPNITIKELPDEPEEPANLTSQSTISQTSTSSSSTSSADCKPPDVDHLGWCHLVSDPRETARGEARDVESSQSANLEVLGIEDETSPARERTTLFAERDDPMTSSCVCNWQTPGQVVTAIVKCGTTMCPNWQTSTESKTKPGTEPWDIWHTPVSTLTFPPARCRCDAPTQDGVGLCSEVHNFFFSGNLADGYHCACESTKVVSYATVCGQTVCPNGKDYTTPISPAKCADSECAWPTNTNLGRCRLQPAASLKWVVGAPGRVGGPPEQKIESHSEFDYCLCQGQSTTLVSAMPACDTKKHICPNQVDLITETWAAATTTSCPEELPKLPFFESCNPYTYTGKETSWRDVMEDVETYTKTYCKCNKPGETAKSDSSWLIPTVSRECDGGYVCHNSVGFIAAEAAIHKVAMQWNTTATAAGFLAVATTDATPGSVPTAAGPTGTVVR